MNLTIIITIILFAIIIGIMFFVFYKTKKPMINLICHSILGILVLIIVNFISLFSGVYLPFNVVNTTTGAILGIPGVISLLILKLF